MAAEHESHVPSYEDFRDNLLSTLTDLYEEGSFAFSKCLRDAPDPALCIKGLGVIGLPLSEPEAQVLITKCQQSPFGKREQTVIDTDVRKSWELDSRCITFQNSFWDNYVGQLLGYVHEELGLSCSPKHVSAQFYKLLLYEEGAFFKKHQDSEKVPGMFGTLVITLPSEHSGGAVVLSHGQKQHVYNSAPTSDRSTSCAAWYADVLHEVKPVTSGYRLVLTYNLVQSNMTSATLEAPLADHKAQLQKSLRTYEQALAKRRKSYPPYLIHTLEHPYTEANLALCNLKGKDLKQVSCLYGSCQDLGFEMLFATFVKRVNRNDDYPFPNYDEREITLESLYTIDGQKCSFKPLYDENCSLNPDTADEDGDHDESEHEGYTGNAGAWSTYWYRDMVVIIVPPSKVVGFVCSGTNISGGAKWAFDGLIERACTSPSAMNQLKQLCRKVLLLRRQREDSWQQSRSHATSLSKTPPWSKDEEDCMPIIWEAILECGLQDIYKKFPEECRITHWAVRMLGCHIAKSEAMEQYLCWAEQTIGAVAGITAGVQLIENLVNSFLANNPFESNQRIFEKWLMDLLRNFVNQSSDGTRADCLAYASLIGKSRSWNINVDSEILEKLFSMPQSCLIPFVATLANDVICPNVSDRDRLLRMSLEKLWSDFEYFDKSTGAQREVTEAGSALTEELIKILAETKRLKVKNMIDAVGQLKSAISGSEPSAKHTSIALIPLVRAIVDKEVPGLVDEEDQHLLEALSSYIKAVLQHHINLYIDENPSNMDHWSLPNRGCGSCVNCLHVADFMADPSQKELSYAVAPSRRPHLNAFYNDVEHQGYTVGTIKSGRAQVWRCVKKLSPSQTLDMQWPQRRQEAKTLLADLSKQADLLQYLGGRFDEVMSCTIEKQPIHKPVKILPSTRGVFQEDGQSSMYIPDPTRPPKRKRPLRELVNNRIAETQVERAAKMPRVTTPEVIDLTDS